MKKFLRNNGLSIVFSLLFLASMCGQFVTGFNYNNEERTQEGQRPLSVAEYIHSGHFIQATFENWESEFLQMALFILLTISFRQKGSSESKKMSGKEEVDREPSKRSGAPWPVHKGGLVLKIYKNSLTIAFALLFIFSLLLHFYGSLKDENEQLTMKGLSQISADTFIHQSRFWFESFQNWQSEFLSVFSIVVLSIFLRHKGSPQSKGLYDPDSKTGD